MQSLKAFLARFRRLSIGHKINRPLDAGLEERGKHEPCSMPVTERTVTPISPNVNVVVAEEMQDVEKPSTATNNPAGLLSTPNDAKPDALKAVYDQRAASIRRQKDLEKAMQEALVRAQENQEFYIKAQREYHEIDDKIDTDNERIREISGTYDEVPTASSPAFVGAITEIVNSRQRQFLNRWQDLESDTSSLSSHYVNLPT